MSEPKEPAEAVVPPPQSDPNEPAAADEAPAVDPKPNAEPQPQPAPDAGSTVEPEPARTDPPAAGVPPAPEEPPPADSPAARTDPPADATPAPEEARPAKRRARRSRSPAPDASDARGAPVDQPDLPGLDAGETTPPPAASAGPDTELPPPLDTEIPPGLLEQEGGTGAHDAGIDVPKTTAPPFFGDVEATVNLGGDLLASFPLRDDLAGDTDEPTADEPEEPAAEAPKPAATDVARTHLKGLLEALVFVSDKPIGTAELAKAASAKLREARELLAELKAEYATRGVQLDEVAGGWIFRTSAVYAPFVRDLTKQKPVRLTRAQVETLAILAYRQPITRPEIEEIRGVDCGATLKLLLERDLVRILGKKDEPGRPLLYGTTHQFLEFFGLKSLKDLPTLREFTELTDESRRVVEEELGEDAVAPPAPPEAEPPPADKEAATDPNAPTPEAVEAADAPASAELSDAEREAAAEAALADATDGALAEDGASSPLAEDPVEDSEGDRPTLEIERSSDAASATEADGEAGQPAAAGAEPPEPEPDSEPQPEPEPEPEPQPEPEPEPEPEPAAPAPDGPRPERREG